ncbi:MAG: hypothetical protein ACYCYI_01650 [Saccharofermentanales bacterium]
MKKENFILLDKLLHDGWFISEEESQPWILARRILVNNQLSYSLKEKISKDAEIKELLL